MILDSREIKSAKIKYITLLLYIRITMEEVKGEMVRAQKKSDTTWLVFAAKRERA